jgi:hypothetical protein
LVILQRWLPTEVQDLVAEFQISEHLVGTITSLPATTLLQIWEAVLFTIQVQKLLPALVELTVFSLDCVNLPKILTQTFVRKKYLSLVETCSLEFDFE